MADGCQRVDIGLHADCRLQYGAQELPMFCHPLGQLWTYTVQLGEING